PGHRHVGDRKPELGRLALDAPVPPVRIVSGEPEKQRPPLRIAGRTLPGRAMTKGRPLEAAMDHYRLLPAYVWPAKGRITSGCEIRRGRPKALAALAMGRSSPPA